MARSCGECTLCCKLVPVVEMRYGAPSFLKLANHKCPFQRHGKGCTEYNNPRKRPQACFVWACRWLSGKDTADQPRPDRAGYVIDEAPDMATIRNNETGELTHMPAVQIWVGKGFPGKSLPQSLARYMERQANLGCAVILRLCEKRAAVYTRFGGVWRHEVTEASIDNAPADIAAVWREHGLA